MRRQGADRAGQLVGRARGVEAALGRVDLLGVGRPSSSCSLELQPPRGAQVERLRPAARRRARRAAPRAPRSPRPGRSRPPRGARPGPESRPAVDPHDADAGALVAGHDRPLDRRRAAPARQQRGMDVEHRPARRAAARGSAGRRRRRRPPPAAAARIRSSAPSSLTLSAWSSSIPSSRAASAAGGGRVLRPRPLGRSGGVTTSAGRCGESASRRSTVGGELGGPEVDDSLTRRFVARGARLGARFVLSSAGGL